MNAPLKITSNFFSEYIVSFIILYLNYYKIYFAINITTQSILVNKYNLQNVNINSINTYKLYF